MSVSQVNRKNLFHTLFSWKKLKKKHRKLNFFLHQNRIPEKEALSANLLPVSFSALFAGYWTATVDVARFSNGFLPFHLSLRCTLRSSSCSNRLIIPPPQPPLHTKMQQLQQPVDNSARFLIFPCDVIHFWCFIIL